MKPVLNTPRGARILRAIGVLGVIAVGVTGSIMLFASTAAPTLPISQIPLEMATAVRPQVVLAISNSESMDGNMSGAIMTGSGFPNWSATASPFYASSSPQCYTPTGGFVPPVLASSPTICPTAGTAPYTVDTSGILYDNSDSRLNLAKSTITSILTDYMQTTDFALVSYNTPSPSAYQTYVYYMSPNNANFFFTNTIQAGATTLPATTVGTTGITSTTMVNNPCYGYTSSSPLNGSCSSIDLNLPSTAFSTPTSSKSTAYYKYMVTAASSDDANINDVLYDGGAFTIGFDYGTVKGKSGEVINTGGTTPTQNWTTPYEIQSTGYNPSGYQLSDYTGGGVSVGYGSVITCCGSTNPTNAGYVPFSQQVMYSARGFGYGSSSATTSITTNVSMTNLGQYLPNLNTTEINTAISTFTSVALNAETNTTNTHEIKSSSGQSPLGLLMTGAKAAFAPSGSSSDPDRNCNTPQYVILITDGQPTEDSATHKAWPPLGTDAAVNMGVTAGFNIPSGNLGTNPTAPVSPSTSFNNALASSTDQALIDVYNQVFALNTPSLTYVPGSTTILSNGAAGPTLAGSSSPPAGIVFTYVIGLGNGVGGTGSTAAVCNNCSPVQQQAFNVLNALAYAGGTGQFYPATSPIEVQAQLNKIMLDIQAHTLATVASSANSTHLSANSVEYQATYTSQNVPYLDWTGEVFAEGLSIAGVPSGTKKWSAQALLDGTAPTSRVIATCSPSSSLASPWLSSACGVPFEVPGGPGISSTQLTELQPSDTNGALRLAYLRGDTSHEVRNSGAFRNRTHLLGDIINSQPAYVGNALGLYSGDSTYVTYAINSASRQGMLYVGSNDGMLHAFNATTGVEQFAFIPSGVFSSLVNLTAPAYNLNHQYFVDGSPQVADVKFGGSCTGASCWHTLVIGGEGGGGRSIYALDATTPSSLTSESAVASALLWEFNPTGSSTTGDPNMGLSYSKPVTTLTSATGAANGFTVFFGNGYNSYNGSAVLYALDAQTGTVLATIDLCKAPGMSSYCNTSLPNGLSTVAVANPAGQPDQPSTALYAGDLQGNMWAVNITSANPASWTVRCLYQGKSGAAQPITTAPTITQNPNFPAYQGLFVMFGTGELLTTSDLTSTTTQTVFGIWDNPSGTAPYALSSLKQQTETYVSAASAAANMIPNPNAPPATIADAFPQAVLTSTSNTINWTTQDGWYVNLPVTTNSGARILSDPLVYNGGFLAVSNAPPAANTCGATWASYYMYLNYQTGGAFTTAHLDANGDGTINSSDLYYGSSGTGTGTAPVALSLGSGFASGLNTFGLNGVSVITVASIADIGSINTLAADIAALQAAIAAAQANPTLANVQAAYAAAQTAAAAATAAASLNGGNVDVSNAQTYINNAVYWLNQAVTATNVGGTGAGAGSTTQTTDIDNAAGATSTATNYINPALINQVKVNFPALQRTNLPWWQVL